MDRVKFIGDITEEYLNNVMNFRLDFVDDKKTIKDLNGLEKLAIIFLKRN